ncbi:ABC transporter permease [Georgenia faecalis]|uniref:ABC transporter permease n=1 Tax=Georgenia faecalis TaxID=2483799 RepID=UPI000FDCC7CB|nr:ABC transporter permease [Georgenia faecalis]
MVRVTLREIRAHLVRFALSVLAVLLGVAFVTGTFSLRAMLADTFGSIVESSSQGDVYVRGAESAQDGEEPSAGPFGPARGSVPVALAEEVADVDGVTAALPDFFGSVVLVGADGQAVVNGQAPSFGGAVVEDDPAAALVAGRVPTAGDEVALETTALETSGLAIGDTTTVVIGADDVREVTVVGEVNYGNPMVGTTLVLVDPATAEEAFAPDGAVPSIAVYADDDATAADIDALVERVRESVGSPDVEVLTGEEVRDEANEAIQQVIGFLGTFLLVFAFISLFVGAFIIANTFAMSVRQRQREFALLRAVGASPLQVMASVIAQAAVVGLVGSAAGVGAGIGLVAVLRTILERMGMALSGQVAVTGRELAIAMAVGTVVSMLAAAVPARRAATTPPVEAMRDDVVVTERSLRTRAVVGAVLLAGGALAVYRATSGATEAPGTWLGVGTGAVLVGALAVAPVIGRTVLGVLAAPAVAALRPMGRLARGNVTRNPRRTANTAGALMIGMALVSACAVLAASATASTSSIVATEARADLTVQSATFTVPPQAAAALTDLELAGRADATVSGRADVGTSDEDAESMRILGLPASAFGETIDIRVVDGSLDGLADGEVAVQRTTADEEGWEVGTDLVIATDQGEVAARVGAVVESQLLNAPVIMDRALFDAVVPAAGATVLSVFVDAADGVPQADLRDAVETALEPYVVLTAQDAEELTSSLADQVDQAMVILYALLGLSVIIAVLGIVNTLALAVIERTREIGLMRAVGLGRLQLAVTITIESVLTAVFGTLLGVLIGVALASALPSVYADQGLSELAVPWSMLAAIVVLSGVVGVLAALWPAVRATRLPVLQAVATD